MDDAHILLPQLEDQPPPPQKRRSNKKQIDFLPSKTPISILQEILSRRGITPNYELVQIEGAVHEPTFRYRVSFNDNDGNAMGAGKSKKEAKHAAAKALIEKLTGSSNFDHPVQPIANGNISTLPEPLNTSDSETNDDQIVGNPIGWLQEMCMSRRYPPPSYETTDTVGLPHERQFTITCVVLKNREIGQGKSKKLAKRKAAHKMFNRLRDFPIETNEMTKYLDDENNDETKITNVLSRYADLKETKFIATLSNHHSHKVSQFHKTLKHTYGQLLATLQNTCLNDKNVNYVQFLQEIAHEHQFEVTYVDIEEKSYSGRCQCLVQLSTLPVAVCQGQGLTSKDAQASAARTALEYLKIMTKK